MWMKKMRKVLVTGGAGFIGSHLVDRLIDAGHHVAIIDDLSGGKRENVNPYCGFYECDLRDAQKTKKILDIIKPEIVFHLAANAAENKAQFSPIDITSRNYNAFINLLVPALQNGMKRIVVTSSIAVYGALQPPFKETDRPEPEDLYGWSKLMMEESLKILSGVHNFEYVITRPHNVYGPRQNMTDPYRNVVTIFMNALMKRQPYYIYGDGKQRRCFSYIDDVVDALLKCGFDDVHGMIFNIGADKDYSLNELSKVIQKVSGIQIPPVYIADRPQEVKVAISDHTLAKNHLHYQDTMPLEEGLRATWEYALALGPQEPEYTEIELDSPKLPENWRK
jgi:UDP-glucose 4-epimerase